MNRLNQKIIDEFVHYLIKNKYKNKIQDLKLEHCTDEIGNYIYLAIIKIKKRQRRMGYGNAIINDIIQFADEYNVRIKLYISDIFGTSIDVLYEFYRKHGFFLINTDNDGLMIYFPTKKQKQ